MNRAETIRLATRLVVYPIGGFVAIAGTAGGINQVWGGAYWLAQKAGLDEYGAGAAATLTIILVFVGVVTAVMQTGEEITKRKQREWRVTQQERADATIAARQALHDQQDRQDRQEGFTP